MYDSHWVFFEGSTSGENLPKIEIKLANCCISSALANVMRLPCQYENVIMSEISSSHTRLQFSRNTVLLHWHPGHVTWARYC
jgi:hypothetical protein